MRYASEQAIPLPWRCRAQHRLKQLPRDAERNLLLKLRGPDPQDLKPGRLRAAGDCRQQFTLSNPSWPLYHDHRSDPSADAIKHTIYQRQLGLTLNQTGDSTARQDAHVRAPPRAITATPPSPRAGPRSSQHSRDRPDS